MNVSTLPADWEWVTLSAIAVQQPNAIVDGPFGSSLKLSDYVETGVPVLQGKNITNDRFRWFDVRYISEAKANELRRSATRVGDVLIVKIGSIGYSAVVNSLHGYEFAIIPANLAKLTPDPGRIDTSYLHHWMRTATVKTYLQSSASKTAQPALSLGKIRELPLPLPPLPEQRRIAAILDQADALRAKRREALAQLDSLTQSIFIEMFGDPIANSRSWPVVRVQDLLSDAEVFTDGDWVESKDQDPEGDIRLIQLADIGDGYFIDKSQRFLNARTASRLRCTPLKPQDVLVARMPDPLGRACLFPALGIDCVTVVDVCIIRASGNGPDPMWLMSCLNSSSFRRQIEAEATGTTRTRISRGNLAKLLIIAPPLSLQRDFASRAQAVETLKAKHRAALAEADALFASLQHRAFAGQLS